MQIEVFHNVNWVNDFNQSRFSPLSQLARNCPCFKVVIGLQMTRNPMTVTGTWAQLKFHALFNDFLKKALGAIGATVSFVYYDLILATQLLLYD